MDAPALVYQALIDLHDWSTASQIAARINLPVAQVRKALGKLALQGRISRNVVERNGVYLTVWTATRRRGPMPSE